MNDWQGFQFPGFIFCFLSIVKNEPPFYPQLVKKKADESEQLPGAAEYDRNIYENEDGNVVNKYNTWNLDKIEVVSSIWEWWSVHQIKFETIGTDLLGEIYALLKSNLGSFLDGAINLNLTKYGRSNIHWDHIMNFLIFNKPATEIHNHISTF